MISYNGFLIFFFLMKRKSYRKRKNQRLSNQLISESIKVYASAPWWLCMLMGSILFAIFFVWLPGHLENKMANDISTTVDFSPIYRLLIRICKLIGAVTGIAALLFAIKNYFFGVKSTKQGKKDANFLSRLLAFFVD